jgi:hypothetical protein
MYEGYYFDDETEDEYQEDMEDETLKFDQTREIFKPKRNE